MTVNNDFDLQDNNPTPQAPRRLWEWILGAIALAAALALLVFVVVFFTVRASARQEATPAAGAAAPADAPANNAPAVTAPTATPTRAPAATATAMPTKALAVVAVIPTVAPSPVPNADITKVTTQAVDEVMEVAPQGTTQQIEAARADLKTAATDAATKLTALGVDLSNEDNFNTFVGALQERAILNGLFCWADNLGPENETASGGVQRRELSTGGLMHVDHYNDPSLPSVSILVRAGEAAVVAGYGSQFEFPFDRCGQYDFVADASRYAESRRGWGHSGVVFNTLHDALNGAAPIVNLWGLTSERIDQLRPRLWDENPANTEAVRAVTGATVDTAEAACGPARPEIFESKPGAEWVIDASQGPTVVEFWSNWDGIQTPQGVMYHILVFEGQSLTLRGGGTAYHFESGCEDVAKAQLKQDPSGSSIEPYIVQ